MGVDSGILIEFSFDKDSNRRYHDCNVDCGTDFEQVSSYMMKNCSFYDALLIIIPKMLCKH